MGALRRLPAFSAGDWLPVLKRLPHGDRRVALTFDDGPTRETTPVILDTLRRHGAQATFFLSGERAEAAPHLVEAVVRAGHDVFAHGWSHVSLNELPTEVLSDEMSRAETVLSRFRPTPAPYMARLPYASGSRSARIHRAIRSWNPTAQLALWNASLEDHRLADDCPDEAALDARCRSAVDRLLARPDLRGSIIIMHERPYGKDAALAPLIPGLLLPKLLDGLARLSVGPARLEPEFHPSPFARFVLA